MNLCRLSVFSLATLGFSVSPPSFAQETSAREFFARLLSTVRDHPTIICSPNKLEQLLDAAIEVPQQAKVWKKSSIISWDGSVAMRRADHFTESGSYRRFMSPLISTCELVLKLHPGQLCDVYDPGFLRDSKIPYWMSMPPHHGVGPTSLYSTFRVPEFTEPAHIWMEVQMERCASQVGIRVPAIWLTEEVKITAQVQDSE